MKIGVDISQTAYSQTGVANYLTNLVEAMVKKETPDQYVLFFSSFRAKVPDIFINLEKRYGKKKVTIKHFFLPQRFLTLIWNKMHILPIENFIGNVDVFISSDWTQPPSKTSIMTTILYDLIVYKYPQETDGNIVETQKQRLIWVKKECKAIFCISESTKKDASQILGIRTDLLYVSYPGIEL